MPPVELDALMERIESKYSVETIPVRIGDKTLRILQLRDFEQYLEEFVESRNVGILDLPFWAKIWDASFMLAYFLGKQPVIPGHKMLEIGAGIGVVGVYAALCGHDVTISDFDDDAVMFARANCLLNGLPQVKVIKIDWRNAKLQHPYETIVGSEVVYEKGVYPVLVQFLKRALAPGGIIFLAKNHKMPAPSFFVELTKEFKFKQTVQKARTNGEPVEIALYAVRPKD